MDQKFIDAIANVRLVSGTIRIDLMNITGQTDDKKLQFGLLNNLGLTLSLLAARTDGARRDAYLKQAREYLEKASQLRPNDPALKRNMATLPTT